MYVNWKSVFCENCARGGMTNDNFMESRFSIRCWKRGNYVNLILLFDFLVFLLDNFTEKWSLLEWLGIEKYIVKGSSWGFFYRKSISGKIKFLVEVSKKTAKSWLLFQNFHNQKNRKMFKFKRLHLNFTKLYKLRKRSWTSQQVNVCILLRYFFSFQYICYNTFVFIFLESDCIMDSWLKNTHVHKNEYKT